MGRLGRLQELGIIFGMQKCTGFSDGNVWVRKSIALGQSHCQCEVRPCRQKWRQHEPMIVRNRQWITGDRLVSTSGQQIDKVICPLLPFGAVSANMLRLIKYQEQSLVA